jgi:hypothetical protein
MLLATAVRKVLWSIACTVVTVSLGGPAYAGALEGNGAFVGTTIILAQRSQDTDLDRLKTRGAKIVEHSRVKALVDRGRTEKGGLACVGAAQCLILIDNFGSQCKSFVCGNDAGKPVCWCDL